MRFFYEWLFPETEEKEIEVDEKTKTLRHELLKEIKEFDSDLLVPSQPPKNTEKKIYKRKRKKRKN